MYTAYSYGSFFLLWKFSIFTWYCKLSSFIGWENVLCHILGTLKLQQFLVGLDVLLETRYQFCFWLKSITFEFTLCVSPSLLNCLHLSIHINYMHGKHIVFVKFRYSPSISPLWKAYIGPYFLVGDSWYIYWKLKNMVHVLEPGFRSNIYGRNSLPDTFGLPCHWSNSGLNTSIWIMWGT